MERTNCTMRVSAAITKMSRAVVLRRHTDPRDVTGKRTTATRVPWERLIFLQKGQSQARAREAAVYTQLRPRRHLNTALSRPPPHARTNTNPVSCAKKMIKKQHT